MKDVQNQQAEVPIPIKRVGVRHLTVPLTVSDRANGSQHTIATVELGVDLPAQFKGTHMSRFLEAMNDWSEDLSYKSMQGFLQNMRERLNACSAQAVFSFPFFMKKQAPVSGTMSLQGYECRLTGNIASTNALHFLLEVCVPVMTVCPCSKAISDEGAHSQRAEIRIAVVLQGFSWLEEFIEIAENSASSPTYPLIKREDEKFVTETAFANPTFVEDVVRNAASMLQKHPKVKWYKVTVESFESIHAHNAFAVIESQPLHKEP